MESKRGACKRKRRDDSRFDWEVKDYQNKRKIVEEWLEANQNQNVNLQSNSDMKKTVNWRNEKSKVYLETREEVLRGVSSARKWNFIKKED